MDTDRLSREIATGAEEINRLHARIHDTLRRRSAGRQGLEEWKAACAEFHRRYDALCFPGGYDNAFERILAGDPTAMEAAICFLEVRPYFFRSGYMFKQLLRKVRRAPLSAEQAARLAVVQQRLAAWRAAKSANAA